jgi:two-component system, NtrC family, response regulator AtoC
MTHGRILVVEDRERSALVTGLERQGHHVTVVDTLDGASRHIALSPPDLVVAGHAAPSVGAPAICRRIADTNPEIPVVVVSREASLDDAIAALRARASDCVTQPDDEDSVALAVQRSLERRALREQLRQLRELKTDQGPFEELVGASAAMCRVRLRLERIVESDATVLISGESGTGKEIAARALHRHGLRRDGMFVPVNCAAIPPHLIESELFGHSKGAFTDATAPRTGLMLRAHAGVLFLDEVASLPLAVQAKLLRALQERRVRPLGQGNEISFDARVIAATARDLAQEVAAGRFREDLYYRINVLEVKLPSLRARGYDLLLLAQHFLDKHVARSGNRILGLTPGAAGALLAYSWPGNVRELENCIEAAVALARYDHITENDLPANLRPPLGGRTSERAPEGALAPLDVVEFEHIAHVLRSVNGNKAQAARILELDRKTLYRKLKRYGLETPASPAR